MKRLIFKVINFFFRFFGFKGNSVSLIMDVILKDFKNKNVPFSIKLWAWRRGFTGSRVYTYEINETNYRYQIPDFDYLKLHPINGRYSSWIDDKLILKYILAPFDEYLPKYYFQIGNNEILRLMNCPANINTDINGIIELLKLNENLVLKPLSGSLGKGFFKITYKNKKLIINTEESSVEKLIEIINESENYLVTEYIISHYKLREIYDVTPNTLRIQLVRDKNKKPIIMGSFIRFGTKKSGVLETPLAGGIFAYVNSANGVVANAYTFDNGMLKEMDIHPDTNEKFNFVIPFWRQMIDKIFDISNYIPQLGYMGFDIIITDDSFKIIEINSLTANTVLPYYYPFLKDDYTKEFFKRKFKENPKRFKRVLSTLRD